MAEDVNKIEIRCPHCASDKLAIDKTDTVAGEHHVEIDPAKSEIAIAPNAATDLDEGKTQAGFRCDDCGGRSWVIVRWGNGVAVETKKSESGTTANPGS